MRRAVSVPIIIAVVAAPFLMTPALAKLPPLSDEAKAKAAETAAKSAWTDKVGGYKLCQSIERTAEYYRKTAASTGKPAPAATETPACADPGAFVPPVAAASAPPLEAAGAHSPPKTATAPPSSKATAAEIQGTAKK
jgi:hypothetical protein